MEDEDGFVLADSNGDEFNCLECGEYVSSCGYGQKVTCDKCGAVYEVRGVYMAVKRVEK